MLTLRGHRHVARRGGAALLAVGIFLGSGAAACRVEPTITVQTVIGGLANPWDIAFGPNGEMFFTERAGRINVLVGGQRRVLAQPADVRVVGEAGMLGLAVDPNFASNRRIYTCFASTLSGLDVRIVRWVVNANETALTNRTDILTGIPENSSGRHSGCRPRFGPDGMLWIGTGDAAVGTNPQDPQSLGGKVLRITTSGAPAPGNMGPPFRPEIVTYGHRNVQGVLFDVNGRSYAIEHGPDRDDELNMIETGRNYGWDPVPGYNESVPMTDLNKFPNAFPAIWSSGFPTIAPSGGTFLSGPQWAGWHNAVAMAVLKGQELLVLGLTTDGHAVEQVWTKITDHGRLRVAVQGPDGNMYIATDANPGGIFRVVGTPPA